MPDENLPQWKRKLFQQGMAVGWAEGWAIGWVIGLTIGRNLARFGARAICRAKARAICMAKGRTGGKAEEESERLREAVKTKLEELFGDLPEEAQSAVDQTTDIEILYTVLFLAGQPKTLPQYMEQLASGRTAAANHQPGGDARPCPGERIFRPQGNPENAERGWMEAAFHRGRTTKGPVKRIFQPGSEEEAEPLGDLSGSAGNSEGFRPRTAEKGERLRCPDSRGRSLRRRRRQRDLHPRPAGFSAKKPCPSAGWSCICHHRMAETFRASRRAFSKIRFFRGLRKAAPSGISLHAVCQLSSGSRPGAFRAVASGVSDLPSFMRRPAVRSAEP